MFRCVNKIEDDINVEDFLCNIVEYLEADQAFQAGKFSRWSNYQKSSYITALIRGMTPSKFIFADVNACLEYAKENEQVLDVAYYEAWLISGVSYLNIDSNNRTINLIAFSKDELGAAAKLVNDFKKDNDLLKPVAMAVNGELIDVEKLSQIAALPNRDQAISMLMAVMKLPIEKFVRTLSAPNVKLVQTLSAYKMKLEQN